MTRANPGGMTSGGQPVTDDDDDTVGINHLLKAGGERPIGALTQASVTGIEPWWAHGDGPTVT